MRVLYGSRKGSGSITNEENQEEDSRRQEDVESPGAGELESQETERRSTQGLESEKNHEGSPQTEAPDVILEYKDARLEIDLLPIEWIVVAFIVAMILFALDMMGYY